MLCMGSSVTSQQSVENKRSFVFLFLQPTFGIIVPHFFKPLHGKSVKLCLEYICSEDVGHITAT